MAVYRLFSSSLSRRFGFGARNVEPQVARAWCSQASSRCRTSVRCTMQHSQRSFRLHCSPVLKRYQHHRQCVRRPRALHSVPSWSATNQALVYLSAHSEQLACRDRDDLQEFFMNRNRIQELIGKRCQRTLNSQLIIVFMTHGCW